MKLAWKTPPIHLHYTPEHTFVLSVFFLGGFHLLLDRTLESIDSNDWGAETRVTVSTSGLYVSTLGYWLVLCFYRNTKPLRSKLNMCALLIWVAHTVAQQESELLMVLLTRSCRNILCATGEGLLSILSWRRLAQYGITYTQFMLDCKFNSESKTWVCIQKQFQYPAYL